MVHDFMVAQGLQLPRQKKLNWSGVVHFHGRGIIEGDGWYFDALTDCDIILIPNMTGPKRCSRCDEGATSKWDASVRDIHPFWSSPFGSEVRESPPKAKATASIATREWCW
jgi:hypothetical protein